jgi:hypothetical protein
LETSSDQGRETNGMDAPVGTIGLFGMQTQAMGGRPALERIGPSGIRSFFRRSPFRKGHPDFA